MNLETGSRISLGNPLRGIEMVKQVFSQFPCLLILSLTGTLIFWGTAGSLSVLAQSEVGKPQESQSEQPKPTLPDQFSNPLEIKEPDPLLPKPPTKKRPLTEEERLALEKTLDELNLEAAALMQAGKPVEAFQVWYRELRLRRYLGPVAEVQALTRVAKVALAQDYATQVQLITQRLQLIYLEAQAEPPIDPQLLQALADAFVAVNARKEAVDVYQRILANAQAAQDRPAQETALKMIAELEFGGLNFAQAAEAYEALLTLSEAKVNRTPQDTLNEDLYLDQLAFIYDQIEAHQKAFDTRTKILNRYRKIQDPSKVAALKTAMGEDSQALGKLNQASQYYKEAYTLAWTLQQYAEASQALNHLAKLYQSNNEGEAALQVYQVLVVVDQRGVNLFGMMNTYDQMGKIYLEQKAYTQALAAFQKGLELAQQLKYQEEYFTRQIDSVNQQRGSR
jgi:tetratricopeptide (TPR) repeat protein